MDRLSNWLPPEPLFHFRRRPHPPLGRQPDPAAGVPRVLSDWCFPFLGKDAALTTEQSSPSVRWELGMRSKPFHSPSCKCVQDLALALISSFPDKDIFCNIVPRRVPSLICLSEVPPITHFSSFVWENMPISASFAWPHFKLCSNLNWAVLSVTLPALSLFQQRPQVAGTPIAVNRVGFSQNSRAPRLAPLPPRSKRKHYHSLCRNQESS